MYKNALSCVMNNGFMTGPFLLGRGVSQGDPLSPYLFILALETLAIKIREDCNVQGLKIGEGQLMAIGQHVIHSYQRMLQRFAKFKDKI